MVQKTIPNPIKIIKLINGDDIVCTLPAEQLGDKSPLLRLSKPLQVKYIPQLTATGLKDYVALIKWSPYTKDFVLTIPKDKIMTIVNANNDMSKSYNYMMTNYLLKNVLQTMSYSLLINCVILFYPQMNLEI